MHQCSSDTSIKRSELVLVDTVRNTIIKDTVITQIIERDTTIYNTKVITVDEPIEGRGDSLRTYAGIYSFDYGNIYYTAKVSGFLEGIRFQSELKIPERTITINHREVITKTIAAPVRDKGLYISALANTNAALGVGVQYQSKRWLTGAYYDTQGTVSLSVGFRVFGW